VLVRHVKAIAAVHRPIRVRLAGFAGSADTHLFARVTHGNDELIALHDDLYSGVLALALDRTSIFITHVTVGQLDSALALRAALGSVNHDLSWEFDVAALAIYRLRGEQPGAIEASISLAHACY
jgi:2'-5' RNA ligase